MTAGLAVTGWGLLCATGPTPAALADAVTPGTATVSRSDVRTLYDDLLPAPTAAVVADFDIRKALGRKGTSFLDRATGLALVACGEALRDRGLVIDDGNRSRIGVALGTTTGSLKSTMDYCRDTLVQDRPYLVNPVLFPNTVMNCAAGQAAIWYGLRGVNATVAGGQLAFLHTLRYAANSIARGYVDVLLAGAVEEFTPQTAWTAARTGAGTAGEAAVVFVLEPVADAGRRDADILAVTAGFDPDGTGDALTSCVRRALDRARVTSDRVRVVATGDPAGESTEADAAMAALDGGSVERLTVKAALGECQAATGALALAALLARHRDDTDLDGQVSVLTGRSRDGAVAAAVVRGWSRAGVDHG